MQKLVLMGLMVVAPLAFGAQEARELPEFRSITSEGAFKLVVTAGQKQSVVITADEPLLAGLTTKVVGDDLVISMAHAKVHNGHDKIKISIGVAQLKRFQMDGVGDTTLNNVSGESFQLNYQGVGALTVHGKVQRFVLTAKGVGTINARGLDAQNVDASLEGVGSVIVRAGQSLNAKVQGIGSLTYYGKPAQIAKSVEGIGSIRAAD